MPLSSGLLIPPAGVPISSRAATYTFLGSQITTSASLGNGTLRAAPVYVPKRVTLDRIGAEITSIGEVGSLLRLGIYRDNGNIYPGALLLDAGTILGDSATAQEKIISQVLDPGVYWLAGVVQAAAVLQPTVRTVLEFPLAPISAANTSMSSDAYGVNQSSVTGVLPATFSTTVQQNGVMPRIFVRAA